MNRFTAAVLAVVLCLTVAGRLTAEENTFVFENFQTAGINGLHWDATQPAAFTVDAVHRSVLLRFPGAARAIAAKLREGFKVEKAEVLFDYEAFELHPPEYTLRHGAMIEAMKADPPRWHLTAYALRKPWTADQKIGPTYNAAINGVVYWKRFGASDTEHDRFPLMLGPTELSEHQPANSMDVSAIFTNENFGETLAQRLRVLDDYGVILKKWESYDHRYDEYWSAYEWKTPTGGHGLTFKLPRLKVTFAPGEAEPGEMPPAADAAMVFADHIADDTIDGEPTAVMPSHKEIREMAQRISPQLNQPDWMPDWQWRRVQELKQIGGGVRFASSLDSGDPIQYAQVVNGIMHTVPRYWQGWGIQDDLLLWYLYGEMLPEPAKANIKTYWDSWLMPDRPTESFYHAQSKETVAYFAETNDWRGRKSFFRNGYNYVISTMNFNHTAAMGALLGGNIIGCERSMADGRHGLEYLPLRLWAWYDGTTQESIDHYYFSITLSGQKMFADFGPTEFDRLMGQSILAKAVEELTSLWHPNLKRFITTSGRTALSHLWVTQGGLEHIIHTLSPEGTLHDVGNASISGMKRYDHNAPAGRIALQTTPGPWAPEWAVNMVDYKPMPYQMTTTFRGWGRFAHTPLWKRSYMTENYGLGSIDIDRGGSVPVMAQWRRHSRPVETVQDIGTLLMRYTKNTPTLLTQNGGIVPFGGGYLATLHHENKMLVLSSPLEPRGGNDRLQTLKLEETTSLQTSIALMNFQQNPTWELYLDGKRIDTLPVTATAGQRIILKDGIAYVAIIPLPSTNLGRDAEIVIGAEAAEEDLTGGGKAKPAILINQYNYRSDKTLAKAAITPEQLKLAYGGFIIEISDNTEFDDFAAFQHHIANTSFTSRWNAAGHTVNATYKSGEDTLEAGFKPEYYVSISEGVPTDQCFPYRRVNGQWAYLEKDMERDSNLTQQGKAGKLEKNGATLLTEPGRMAYLQTEPTIGTFCAFNPLPDTTLFNLKLPGGISVESDGRIGLMRLIVQPRSNSITLNYAVKDEQKTSDAAAALLVFGLQAPPNVERNGTPLEIPPNAVNVNGRQAYVIPLPADTADDLADGLSARHKNAQDTLRALHQPESRPLFVQDWYIVGAFPRAGQMWSHEIASYPPEKGFDADAVYTGFDRVDGEEVEKQVRWKRILKPGSPALGEGAIMMQDLIQPNQSVVGYAYTEITSDRGRDLTLYTGGELGIVLWLNGEKVLAKKVFRACAPDQDKIQVTLRQGVNKILVRTMCAWEGWSFYFRVGDEYGRPITDGLTFGFGK